MVKTYSRKQQRPQIIEDVVHRCRLCLAHTEQALPIFPRKHDACTALALRIMICTGYEVSQDDCLPNIICSVCHLELERSYRFRKRCEDSYRKLKSHFDAAKENNKITELPTENEIIKDSDKITEPTEFKISSISEDKMKPECEKAENVREDPVDELAQLVIADGCVEDKESSETHARKVATVTNVDADENIEETTTEIQVIEQTSEVSPDISTFLNAILVELGIIVKGDQGLMLQDQGVTSFELETGDDDQIMFELVEEDEEESTTDVSFTELDNNKVNETALQITVLDNKKHKRSRKNYGKSSSWCAECGLSLSSANALRRHRARHLPAPPRPHACPHARCGRTFAQKAVLDRHRLLHTERRPFQCALCPRSYTQRGALQAHARSHGRTLALHACTLCDRMFLYASGLSRHMVTHSGRTFPCTTCARPFKDRSSLARHVRNAHPIPEDTAKVAEPASEVDRDT